MCAMLMRASLIYHLNVYYISGCEMKSTVEEWNLVPRD
jgi:hypothetical protein